MSPVFNTPKKNPEVRDAIQSIRSRRPLGSAILRGQPAAPAAPVSSKVSQWDVTAPAATGATAGARPTLGTPYWSPETEVPQVDAATWWKYCWGLLSMMDDGIRNYHSHRQLWTFFTFENTCNTKWGSEKARGLRCMGCQGGTIQKSIMEITGPFPKKSIPKTATRWSNSWWTTRWMTLLLPVCVLQRLKFRSQYYDVAISVSWIPNRWLFETFSVGAIDGCITFCHVNTPRKTNMTMDTPPFEDVFPVENWDFPMSC